MATSSGSRRWAVSGGWVLAVLVIAAAPGAGQEKERRADPTKAKGKDGREVVNDLKQLGLAFHNYHDNMGLLPSAGPAAAPLTAGVLDLRRTPWRIALLPYIEHDNLYKAIVSGKYKGGKGGAEYWLSPELRKACPSLHATAKGSSETRYRVFVGNGAAFEPNQVQRLPNFTDGLSNTILVVEAEEAVPWTSLQELTYDPKKPLPKLGHPSRDGFYALMADGSVHYIPKKTDEKVLRALITRNGGEAVELPGKPAR